MKIQEISNKINKLKVILNKVDDSDAQCTNFDQNYFLVKLAEYFSSLPDNCITLKEAKMLFPMIGSEVQDIGGSDSDYNFDTKLFHDVFGVKYQKKLEGTFIEEIEKSRKNNEEFTVVKNSDGFFELREKNYTGIVFIESEKRKFWLKNGKRFRADGPAFLDATDSPLRTTPQIYFEGERGFTIPHNQWLNFVKTILKSKAVDYQWERFNLDHSAIIRLESYIKQNRQNIPGVDRFEHLFNAVNVIERKKNTMSNKIVDMLKDDAKEAAYRIAADRVTKMVQDLLVEKMLPKLTSKSKRAVDSWNRQKSSIEEFFASDIGKAFLAASIGSILYLAKDKITPKFAPHMERLGREMQMQGMVIATSSGIDAVLEMGSGFIPKIQEILGDVEKTRIALPEGMAEFHVPEYVTKEPVAAKLQNNL